MSDTKEIIQEYDAKELIRKEEMSLLWGADNLPSDEIIELWTNSLASWLDEYVNGTKSEFSANSADSDAVVGQIRKIKISLEPLYIVMVEKKEKDGESRWMYCPISKFKTPGTMWEFSAETKSGKSVVLETWNINTIADGEVASATEGTDESVDGETISEIMTCFDRQCNHLFQNLPRERIGARVFRTCDPRRKYQKEEILRFGALPKLGGKDREEEKKEAIETISKTATNENQ